MNAARKLCICARGDADAAFAMTLPVALIGEADDGGGMLQRATVAQE